MKFPATLLLRNYKSSSLSRNFPIDPSACTNFYRFLRLLCPAASPRQKGASEELNGVIKRLLKQYSTVR